MDDLQLYHDGLAALGNLRGWSRAAGLMQLDNTTALLCAFLDGRCVGFVYYVRNAPGSVGIVLMETRSGYRGLGIGRALLEQLKATNSRVDVYEPLPTALAFYVKLGFVQPGPGSYSETDDDGLSRLTWERTEDR